MPDLAIMLVSTKSLSLRATAHEIYMYVNGYVYKSVNRGQTFTRTAFFKVPADTFAGDRIFGRFMAVDPINADVLYVGTPTSGAFVTTNGGATFSHITSIANGTPVAIAGILIAVRSLIGCSRRQDTRHLHFELWHRGLPFDRWRNELDAHQ